MSISFFDKNLFPFHCDTYSPTCPRTTSAKNMASLPTRNRKAHFTLTRKHAFSRQAAMTYVLSRTVDYGNGGCVGFSPNFLFNLRQFLPQNRVFRVHIKFSPYYNTTNLRHNQEVIRIVYIFRRNLSVLTKSDRILQKKKHLNQEMLP